MPPMEIRVIRRPPAPRMDGFDVGGFKVGRVYTVDDPLANYLVSEGYAVSVKPKDRPNQSKREKRR